MNVDGNTIFADNIVEFNGGKNAQRVFVLQAGRLAEQN